jgi:hypothetical protein
VWLAVMDSTKPRGHRRPDDFPVQGHYGPGTVWMTLLAF